jgi:threonine dehydrogenase-like Zn-dependent dehydrogenase
VLLKVVYSGICGTDKHTFGGKIGQYAPGRRTWAPSNIR